MTKTQTKYGYMHMTAPDYDGTYPCRVWIEDYPQEDDDAPILGWYAKTDERDWLGAFETEEEAIHTLTNDNAYNAYTKVV